MGTNCPVEAVVRDLEVGQQRYAALQGRHFTPTPGGGMEQGITD